MADFEYDPELYAFLGRKLQGIAKTKFKNDYNLFLLMLIDATATMIIRGAVQKDQAFSFAMQRFTETMSHHMKKLSEH